MKFSLILSVVIFPFLTACSLTAPFSDIYSYQDQINQLSQHLSQAKKENIHLAEENRYLKKRMGYSDSTSLVVIQKEEQEGMPLAENSLYGWLKEKFKKKNKKDFFRGRRVFTKKYPNSRFSSALLYMSGKLRLSSQTHKSLSDFDQLIHSFPSSKVARLAFLGKAQAYKKLGLTQQSQQALRDLIQKHPQSTEAKRAALYLKDLKPPKGKKS